MKLISSTHGTVILHASPDDVCPKDGFVQNDLLQFVGDAYQFSFRPTIPPNMPPQMFPILTFQSGKLVTEKETYAIQQLVVMPNGDLITGRSTNAADAVLDDYMKRLDEGLKYRFREFQHTRTYVSGIVVQFDEGVEDRIAGIHKMEEILNRRIPRPASPFKIKALAFGHGDPLPPQLPPSLDLAEKADFSLQRRQGEPYAENRYFSSAPLRTDDHVALLEEIEEALKPNRRAP